MHKGRQEIIKERRGASKSYTFAENDDVDELIGHDEVSKGIFFFT